MNLTHWVPALDMWPWVSIWQVFTYQCWEFLARWQSDIHKFEFKFNLNIRKIPTKAWAALTLEVTHLNPQSGNSRTIWGNSLELNFEINGNIFSKCEYTYVYTYMSFIIYSFIWKHLLETCHYKHCSRCWEYNRNKNLCCYRVYTLHLSYLDIKFLGALYKFLYFCVLNAFWSFALHSAGHEILSEKHITLWHMGVVANSFIILLNFLLNVYYAPAMLLGQSTELNMT